MIMSSDGLAIRYDIRMHVARNHKDQEGPPKYYHNYNNVVAVSTLNIPKNNWHNMVCSVMASEHVSLVFH